MGVLYYLARDDNRELFALNKMYAYSNGMWEAFGEPTRVAEVAPDCDSFVARFMGEHPEWGRRVYARLAAWAGDMPVHITTDQSDCGGIHDGLTYDEHRAKITGSAHDSDYESDGVTYKRGSAW